RVAHQRKVARLAQFVAPCRSATVLPDDGPMTRLAAAPRPRHHGLALVGDTDGGDGLLERAHQFGQYLGHRRPDLFGVVFDPARLRKMLRELTIRPYRRPTAVVVCDSSN